MEARHEEQISQFRTRLDASQQLLAHSPELFFEQPQLAASVFDIELSEHFIVIQVGAFVNTASLIDNIQASRVRHVSPAMAAFLDMPLNTIQRPLDVPWELEGETTLGNAPISDSVTLSELPEINHKTIRRWQLTKRITVPSGHYAVECKGYFLPASKVMFVDCGTQTPCLPSSLEMPRTPGTPESSGANIGWSNFNVFGASDFFDFDNGKIDLFRDVSGDVLGNKSPDSLE